MCQSAHLISTAFPLKHKLILAWISDVDVEGSQVRPLPEVLEPGRSRAGSHPELGSFTIWT